MKFLKLTLLLLTLALPAIARLDSAAVTKVINDVRVYEVKKSARPAAIGDKIRGRTSLQTGRRSRAELQFSDKTLTRIGANSLFSFKKGSRDVELKSGSILLQVPKGKAATRIRTATVTAGITGTTLMMEYSPKHWVKLIVLEGQVQLNINGKKNKATVNAGQMLVMNPDGKSLPQVMDVDLKKLRSSSKLLSPRLFGRLPKQARDLIDNAIREQKRLLKKGVLVRTNYRPRGTGTRASNRRTRAGDTREEPRREIPSIDEPVGPTGP